MTLALTPELLKRVEDRARSRARAGKRLGIAKARPRRSPEAAEVAAPAPTTPDQFETEAQARREDCLRARHIRRVLNRPGRTTWLNIADRIWLLKQRSPHVPAPMLDSDAARDLANQLEAGVASDFPPATLASSSRMRTIREGLIDPLLDAFGGYPDAELRTVTVIYSGWSYTPAELDDLTAAKLKAQLRQHLQRAGVFNVPGPLFAVLHGEFDPGSGRYQLHYHLLTTEAKARALKAGLTARVIKGYTKTATGAAPVRRSRVRDRARQYSYLAKAFWPSRPVIHIGGKPKRIRDPRRIPEPYATQVLLWLDRQRLRDLVMTHDCWSLRKGGPDAMKRLYLFVLGAG